MPLVLRVGRYKFYMYFKDEGKPHCHLVLPSGEAKISLDGRILASRGLNMIELNDASKIVRSRQAKLLEIWNEFQKD